MAPCPSSIQRQTTSREKNQKTETAKQEAILRNLKSDTWTVNFYLRGYTSFRDIQQTVVNYVKRVVFKMKNDEDYRSQQRQVYDDLCNFRALRNKLVAEKNYYPIAMYSSEIVWVNAMKKLAKMLCTFSMLLPNGTVPEGYKKWIRNQLNNSDLKELLQIAQRKTKYTYDELRRKYDLKIQSEVEKQTKTPLGHMKNFPVNVDKFRDRDFFDRKNEFKQVQEQISREEKSQKGLSTYLAAYSYTLEAINSSEVDQLENYAC